MAIFKLHYFLKWVLMVIMVAASFASGQQALAPPPRSPELSLEQEPQNARRGVLLNNQSFVRCFDGRDTNLPSYATWYFNHDRESYGATESRLKYVPMLRDLSTEATEHWIDDVKNISVNDKGGPTWALSLHEPDNCSHGGGGSCISIEDAVKGWNTYMEPLKKLKDNMYIVSPSVTNVMPSKNTGLGWLKGFIDACKDCHIDVLAVNWYGSANEKQTFMNFIDNVRTLAEERPIWVTGLRVIGTVGDTINFLGHVMDWMDRSEDIHRYAYVMARSGPGMLVNESGSALTELGNAYTHYSVGPQSA